MLKGKPRGTGMFLPASSLGSQGWSQSYGAANLVRHSYRGGPGKLYGSRLGLIWRFGACCEFYGMGGYTRRFSFLGGI